MNRILVSVALILIGCGNSSGQGAETPPQTRPEEAAEPPREPPQDPPELAGLEWSIESVPETLSMSERSEHVIRIRATNRGTRTVNPLEAALSFRVNGEESFALINAFGNGVRASGWSALPPSETVSDERAMGETLFPEPGRYEIAVEPPGTRATCLVTVTP